MKTKKTITFLLCILTVAILLSACLLPGSNNAGSTGTGENNSSDKNPQKSLKEYIKTEPINKKDAEKITEGMTLNQVTELIGSGTDNPNISITYPLNRLWKVDDGKILNVIFEVNGWDLERFASEGGWKLYFSAATETRDGVDVYYQKPDGDAFTVSSVSFINGD